MTKSTARGTSMIDAAYTRNRSTKSTSVQQLYGVTEYLFTLFSLISFTKIRSGIHLPLFFSGRFVSGGVRMSWAGKCLRDASMQPISMTLMLRLGFKKNVNRATTQVMMKTGRRGVPNTCLGRLLITFPRSCRANQRPRLWRRREV